MSNQAGTGHPYPDTAAGAVAGRARSMPPFLVMEVLERAREMERQGRRVIHMEVGEPDFPTPRPIVAAGRAALDRGDTRYTPSTGLPELREAIAGRYRDEYGVSVDPARVIVTSGTSAALHLVLSALINPGEEVLVTDPGYACYPNFIAAVDGRVRRVPLDRDHGFRLDPAALKTALCPAPKALILNSPANPTGTVMDRQEWEAAAAATASAGTWIIADEIYHGLIYGQECPSALEFTDRAFVIDGFSKRYAMTGWRLGWCVAPPEFTRPLQKLQQNLYICPPAPAQHAALAALIGRRDEVTTAVAEMTATYHRRRDALLADLSRLGLPAGYVPAGAFYVLVDVRKVLAQMSPGPAGGDPLNDDPGYRLALEILEQTGVALTPGVDFGPGGEGYLRFSYATSLEDIQEGLYRLGKYLATTGACTGSD